LCLNLEYFFPRTVQTAINEGKAEGRAEGIAIGETRVLDLVAKGYDYEQIKKILKSKSESEFARI